MDIIEIKQSTEKNTQLSIDAQGNEALRTKSKCLNVAYFIIY
jgi:hypothetical protein